MLLLVLLCGCAPKGVFPELERAECVYFFRTSGCEDAPEQRVLRDPEAIRALGSALEACLGRELEPGAGAADGGGVLSLLFVRDGQVLLRLGCAADAGAVPVLRAARPPRGQTGSVEFLYDAEGWSGSAYWAPGAPQLLHEAFASAEACPKP